MSDSPPTTPTALCDPPASKRTRLDAPGRGRASRALAIAAAVAACVIGAGLAGWVGFSTSAASSMALASEGVSSFSLALGSLLERHEALPRVLALDPRVQSVLSRPKDPLTRDTANRFLETVARTGDLLAVYVIDRQGLTIAASNWNTAQSFVGNNYHFRPYFRDPMAGGIGRFYAIGSTSNQPGYYIASAVREGDEVQGVVVVKVDLLRLQSASAKGIASMVVDEFGVIFLASDPALRYRPVAPLSAGAVAKLAANQVYPGQALVPLDPAAPMQTLPPQLRLRDGHTVRTASQLIEPLRWRVVTFVDMAPAYRAAAAAAAGGASVAALLVALLGFSVLRRQRTLEVKRSRDALFRSQQRLRAVANSLPLMVCFIDSDERHVFANAAYALHYGRTVDQVEGLSLSEVAGEERAALAPHLARAWGGETASFDAPQRGHRGFRSFEATYRPEWNASGTRVVGLHVVIQDVTETRRRLEDLSRLAQLDHLTKLMNRKGFDARLADAIASAAGSGLALLFIDLDDFKPVNDRHGHPTGDALLQAFSKRLSRLVRESDAVARLGGDEFAVILPDISSPRIAHRLAEAIAEMARTPFELDGARLQIGASIGVAVAGPGVDAPTLCKCADLALYEYKRLSKSRRRDAAAGTSHAADVERA
jgi:diguanylate cyclase (GGDEF)-like protein/PAS domain S-box-containing protein